MRAPVLLLLLATASVQAQGTFPGTSIAFPRVAGFELADGFDGLTHPASGASLQVVQLRGGSLAELRVVLAPDTLLRQGYETASVRDTTAGGAPALWADGLQRVGGDLFWKRTLVAETPDGVAVLSASVPVDAPSVLHDVETLLRSVRPAPAAPADRFAGLPFSATLPPGLRDVQRGSRALIAQTERSAPSRARLTLGVETGPPAEAFTTLADVARSRFHTGLGGDLRADTLAVREIRVDGRRAVEVTGRGASLSDGSPRLLYLVLVPAGAPREFVVVHGLGGGATPEAWLEPFRHATALVRWRH